MRQNVQNIALFAVLASVLIGGWYYVEKTFFPAPPVREALLAVAGTPVAPTKPATDLVMRTRPPEPPKPVEPTEPKGEAKPAADAAQPPPQPEAPPAPAEPATLILIGDDESYMNAVLTTEGAGVQQLTLTRFDEGNRLGREVKRADGSNQPLRLIPGVRRDRRRVSLTDIHKNPSVDVIPDLVPGAVSDEIRRALAEPSYVILHYPAKDDPARRLDDGGAANADYPSPELARRTWKLLSSEKATDEQGGTLWKAVFETELAAPYFLRLRKTFTLRPKEYHVGMVLDFEPLPGRVKDKGEFRYQIAGARGLPIEGEWYTYTYRNVMAGWTNAKGGAFRSFEDSLTIQSKHGGEKVTREPGATFDYAAVATQYFASAVAIDDTQPPAEREKMWDFVRPTREPAEWDRPDQLFLADVTVRAVSSPLAVAPDQPVTHKYLLYNGPVKVSQLGQLRDTSKRAEAVDAALVERYLDKLNLRTMTDSPSPTVFGQAASFIWWSDLVIFFTNLMHWLLNTMHGLVPVWGLNIVMLTVLVRLILFAPSRKQQAAMMKMQDKMARLKPEIDKIQEKHKDDFYAIQQAKSQLMRDNGVNPASTMGGCLLLFAQMPILMGLYFCLQESVFFRLDPFLGWIPNLAAPDMLLWWSESIPFISSPDSLGSTFYLGPFLNILPILSVALIFMHQKISLPPPTDEQMEMQQRMMKIMVVFMAVFFYKVPAGLCIYFICGTLWALGERKLIKKPTVAPTGPVVPAASPVAGGAAKAPAEPAKPEGWLARKVTAARERMEEMQKQAEQQSKRQIRNSPPPDRNGDRRDRKKKRK